MYTLPLVEGLRVRLLRSEMVQRLLAPFGCDLNPQRWIFIVGCYNSGTTLLNAILREHDEISGLQNEGVALTDALPRPEEFGWTRMWCRCLDQIRMEPGPDMEKKARRARRQWSFSYQKSPENCLEKSIANTARMPFLEAYFQPAYFIHIVRNGYAVAEGIQRKADPARWDNPVYTDTYPIELCAEQWRVTDKTVRQDREDVERYLQVRYEELACNPKSTICEITDFLEIKPLDESKISGTWNVSGYEKPIQNMNLRSFVRLSSQDMNKIEEVAGDLLELHGYQRPSL